MWPFSSSTSIIEQSPKPLSDKDSSSAASISSSGSQIDTSNSANIPQDEINPFAAVRTAFANERLGLHVLLRAPMLAGVAGICGFALGGSLGGRVAADRYRAENAHRMPTTRAGWYQYHKYKNYEYILGSGKEGFKRGIGFMGWALLFCGTEEVIDSARATLFGGGGGTGNEGEDHDGATASRQRDVLSTVTAALATAGFYSWRQGLDRFATARMSKVALKYSLIYGLAQDTLSTVRGRTPAYIDRPLKMFWNRDSEAL